MYIKGAMTVSVRHVSQQKIIIKWLKNVASTKPKSTLCFYPWSPKVEPWVNRWTFSPPPPPPPSPPSHHQIFVSLRYRKRHGGGGEGEWALCCVYHFVYLKILTSSRRERWPLDLWLGVLLSEPQGSRWTVSEFTPSIE